MHKYTHPHIHACTHTHMHTCTHAHMHTCTHAHKKVSYNLSNGITKNDLPNISIGKMTNSDKIYRP
jgi:hypothetical protein